MDILIGASILFVIVVTVVLCNMASQWDDIADEYWNEYWNEDHKDERS